MQLKRLGHGVFLETVKRHPSITSVTTIEPLKNDALSQRVSQRSNIKITGICPAPSQSLFIKNQEKHNARGLGKAGLPSPTNIDPAPRGLRDYLVSEIGALWDYIVSGFLGYTNSEKDSKVCPAYCRWYFHIFTSYQVSRWFSGAILVEMSKVSWETQLWDFKTPIIWWKILADSGWNSHGRCHNPQSKTWTTSLQSMNKWKSTICIHV